MSTNWHHLTTKVIILHLHQHHEHVHHKHAHHQSEHSCTRAQQHECNLCLGVKASLTIAHIKANGGKYEHFLSTQTIADADADEARRKYEHFPSTQTIADADADAVKARRKAAKKAKKVAEKALADEQAAKDKAAEMAKQAPKAAEMAKQAEKKALADEQAAKDKAAEMAKQAEKKAAPKEHDKVKQDAQDEKAKKGLSLEIKETIAKKKVAAMEKRRAKKYITPPNNAGERRAVSPQPMQWVEDAAVESDEPKDIGYPELYEWFLQHLTVDKVIRSLPPRRNASLSRVGTE